jgi:acetylornithine deacetylase/succinyl-diaminopimelate desuccinylase-like protein
MDDTAIQKLVEDTWNDSIVPNLLEYIRIPNKSPHFDADWTSHGHMDQAVGLAEAWCRAQPIAGMCVEVVRLPGRTPVLFIEIPGDPADGVLLYGHLDKQPEMTGWRDGLGPWTPVIEGERLYGRGGADDGYAVFASLTAVRAVQEQGLSHTRCVVLIECCEESGSFDLPHYVEALRDRIGSPSLVICLDSGCGNYEQLWCTTSLRGLVGGTLAVEVLTEGVHSGDASGIVPGGFRVLRQVLSRLEDERTGEVLLAAVHADIPPERIQQAGRAAEVLGETVYTRFPFLSGVGPVSKEPRELILNRTWRPALSVTGADGLPPLANAGNVTLPRVAVKLSLRLPPTCNARKATEALKRLLERDPPSGARVCFQPDQGATGWNAPSLSPWLTESLERASRAYFGKPALYMGEGGSIPFIGMLGESFPQAQFLITGVLGPQSNAHGPNEFLHLPTAKRLTSCVARVLADHHARTA